MPFEKFATAINCIDGRTQLPVIEYLKHKWQVNFIDDITEVAPVKILSEPKNSIQQKIIKQKIAISIEKHNSKHIAIIAHHDCAGNPVEKNTQIEQLKKSMQTINSWGFKCTILGLYLNENWQVQEIQQNKENT